MKDRIIIGSRGSALALTQTNQIADQIRSLYPQTRVEVRIVKTQGDKILDVPLAKIGDKGLFVKELENALLSKEVDLAVHSMKDLPTEIPSTLTIAAIPPREDPHDALVLASGLSGVSNDDPLMLLPPNARVGSSSLRRKSQLLHHRLDLQIENLRGNLDTRLHKLDEGQYDAIILASAGLIRLGWADRITAKIPFSLCLPAVGQGALALECRSDDLKLIDSLKILDDAAAHAAVKAERALMYALEGGCQVPIGAHAQVEHDRIMLEGMIASLSGEELIRSKIFGSSGDAEELGNRLAEKLLASGGRKILDQVRAQARVTWSEPDGGRNGSA